MVNTRGQTKAILYIVLYDILRLLIYRNFTQKNGKIEKFEYSARSVFFTYAYVYPYAYLPVCARMRMRMFKLMHET